MKPPPTVSARQAALAPVWPSSSVLLDSRQVGTVAGFFRTFVIVLI
jgi:hypothetical protein